VAELALDPYRAEIERSGPVSPLLPMNVDGARAAMVAYQELCAAVLTPDDWIGRPGEAESFVKRSGWDKLATFYGVSTELVGDTHLERDDAGALVRAGARARATARDGRFAEGGGACGRNEPRFANARGRQKIEHDLPATAETRATNRAIANLIGFGSVSAEEVDDDVRAGREADLPAWAADIPNDAVDRVGNYLATILRELGHPEPDREALKVGNSIVNTCGGRFPDACARLVRLLEQAIPRPEPEAEAEAGDDDLPWEGEAAEADGGDHLHDAAGDAQTEPEAKPPEFDGTDETPNQGATP
jgi:hypothetical protein